MATYVTRFFENFTGTAGTGVAGRSSEGVTWVAIGGVNDIKLDGAGNGVVQVTSAISGCKIDPGDLLSTSAVSMGAYVDNVWYGNADAVVFSFGGLLLRVHAKTGDVADIYMDGVLVVADFPAGSEDNSLQFELIVNSYAGTWQLFYGNSDGGAFVFGDTAVSLTTVFEVYVYPDFASGTPNRLNQFEVSEYYPDISLSSFWVDFVQTYEVI